LLGIAASFSLDASISSSSSSSSSKNPKSQKIEGYYKHGSGIPGKNLLPESTVEYRRANDELLRPLLIAIFRRIYPTKFYEFLGFANTKLRIKMTENSL
jgi:hypothetical protein